MSYLDRIRAAQADPETLEQTYRDAVQRSEDNAFTDAIEQVYTCLLYTSRCV